jgi:hypothetical protein
MPFDVNGNILTTLQIKNYNEVNIVRSGLILYLDTSIAASYPGSGTTWSDLSGNGYNATMSGTVPYVVAKPSYFNYAASGYRFDGNNSLASNVSTAVTIISVAYITDMSQRSYLFSKFRTSASPYGYVLEVGTESGLWTNSLRFYGSGNNNNSTDLRGTQSFSANTNYMFSVTYNQSTGANIMYVNNNAITATQAGVGSDSGVFQGNNNYKIGTLVSSERSYMRQYNVMVYNRVLTPAEITQNYNVMQSKFSL